MAARKISTRIRRGPAIVSLQTCTDGRVRTDNNAPRAPTTSSEVTPAFSAYSSPRHKYWKEIVSRRMSTAFLFAIGGYKIPPCIAVNIYPIHKRWKVILIGKY
eukprot:scpid58345/ scgid11070/ 